MTWQEILLDTSRPEIHAVAGKLMEMSNCSRPLAYLAIGCALGKGLLSRVEYDGPILDYLTEVTGTDIEHVAEVCESVLQEIIVDSEVQS